MISNLPFLQLTPEIGKGGRLFSLTLSPIHRRSLSRRICVVNLNSDPLPKREIGLCLGFLAHLVGLEVACYYAQEAFDTRADQT